MDTRKILAAAWLCVLAASATAVAQVECEPAGVAKKLQLPFVRAHAPCGFHGHEPDGSAAWGSSCSAATTGTDLLVGSCGGSAQACTTNSECSEGVCYTPHPGVSADAPCDGGNDCSPCDAYGNCEGSSCLDVSPFGGQVCGAADNRYDGTYEFGPKGSCTLLAKSKALKSCAALKDRNGFPLGLADTPCHATSVSVRCKDIRGQEGNAINGAVDEGFALQLHTRMTLENATIVDLPSTQFSFSTPLDGSMDIEQTLAEPLLSMFFEAPNLPTCTTMEIRRAEIVDPSGNLFATVGLATR